ncbi:MAG TPA: phosphopantetheine-binding protein, partial [Blastocatellia bacterium]|nr:phosphopantetheine-binding protein [Blastocatellia bacterium]
PFGAPGSRMYATGDEARYTAGGEIEYLGRLDHQVKIRGFRIELGEIESVLSRHPEVRDSVVVARQAVDGDKYLAAFIVPDGEAPSTDELRVYLRRELPDYMVPRAFAFLQELPLTSSGKVDRRALPDAEWSGQAESRSYEAPRTPVEEVVAGIWADVLSLDQVGIHENFFDLGGHSLLVTKVISRVRSVFDVEIPLMEMIETPTVAAFADLIDRALKEESFSQSGAADL